MSLRIALIGCGTWGASHAQLYHEDRRVTLAAVCDQNRAKAEALAQRLGLPQTLVFDDYERMIEQVDCDAVSIVTPDFSHAAPAIFCARHQKHLLIEKPLATTRADADAMLAAIRENGVRAMVDFHNRWNPPFAVMKEEVRAGLIGRPYSAYFRLNDQKWVATRMLPWAAKSSILRFLGSHAVDTLRWLFESEVDTVYAVAREGLLKAEGVDTVDMYQYTLRFRNGCIAQVENGWITPDTHGNVNDFKCNLLGTEGMYNLDLSDHNLIRRFAAPGSAPSGQSGAAVPDILVNTLVRQTAQGFAYQSIHHFVDCLIEDRPFYVSLEDAYNVTTTILGVFEAAKTGLPVRIEGLL